MLHPNTMVFFVLSTWNHIHHVTISTTILLSPSAVMFFSICIPKHLNPNYISTLSGWTVRVRMCSSVSL